MHFADFFFPAALASLFLPVHNTQLKWLIGHFPRLNVICC